MSEEYMVRTIGDDNDEDPYQIMKQNTLKHNQEIAEEIRKEKEEQLRKALEAKLRKKEARKESIPPKPKQEKPSVANEKDFLVLEDIVCKDADGNVFERYGKIYVAKDVFREGKNPINFTIHKAIAYCEKKGLSLPSMALSCNIVARLYANRKDKEVNKVLMQYKDYGSGYGWHAQNTVVDYDAQKIIHYPNDNDFPGHGGKENINNGMKRSPLGFSSKGLSTATLEDGLSNKNIEMFVRSFTGLEDPSILIEIGKHFGRTAIIRFPDNPLDCKDTWAAWLGYDRNGSFYTDANCDFFFDSFSYSNAARGVRVPKPAAKIELTGCGNIIGDIGNST